MEDESGALVRHDTDAYAAVELALDSVVKVFTVSSSPNYFLPWQNKAQRESMGSGKAPIAAISTRRSTELLCVWFVSLLRM